MRKVVTYRKENSNTKFLFPSIFKQSETKGLHMFHNVNKFLVSNSNHMIHSSALQRMTWRPVPAPYRQTTPSTQYQQKFLNVYGKVASRDRILKLICNRAESGRWLVWGIINTRQWRQPSTSPIAILLENTDSRNWRMIVHTLDADSDMWRFASDRHIF